MNADHMAAELSAARADAERANELLRRLAVSAVADGMTRIEVHRLTGVARTTLNRWVSEDYRQ